MIGTAKYLIDIGRKSIRTNLDWGGSYDKLSNLKNELSDMNNESLISESVNKDEYSTRFFHLSLTKYACGIALIFSGLTSFFENSPFGIIACYAATILFGIMFIQFSYRSWVAEFIWVNWDRRFKIKKPRFSKFLANATKKPIILFSINLS